MMINAGVGSRAATGTTTTSEICRSEGLGKGTIFEARALEGDQGGER